MVKQWQKLFFKGRLSASDRSLHKKDFVKAAQADGFRHAVRLERKQDVPRVIAEFVAFEGPAFLEVMIEDRKSTRLNSSHSQISYAVFCLKKKKANFSS